MSHPISDEQPILRVFIGVMVVLGLGVVTTFSALKAKEVRTMTHKIVVPSYVDLKIESVALVNHYSKEAKVAKVNCRLVDKDKNKEYVCGKL